MCKNDEHAIAENNTLSTRRLPLLFQEHDQRIFFLLRLFCKKMSVFCNNRYFFRFIIVSLFVFHSKYTFGIDLQVYDDDNEDVDVDDVADGVSFAQLGNNKQGGISSNDVALILH